MNETAADSEIQDVQQHQPVDLIAIRALYQSVLGARVFPDQDVLFKAITDTEAVFGALCEEIDGNRLHPQLRARYTNACAQGRMHIEQWKATAEVYEGRRADWAMIRRHHSAAFRHAQVMAEHIRTMTEVLTVQRRGPRAAPSGDGGPTS
jgi:2C-methyl-D-erythritol 2,4-cyclodiphosphate synthase